MVLASATVREATYVRLPNGDPDNMLPQDTPGQSQRVRVESFELRFTPVIIGKLQTFVQRHEA